MLQERSVRFPCVFTVFSLTRSGQASPVRVLAPVKARRKASVAEKSVPVDPPLPSAPSPCNLKGLPTGSDDSSSNGSDGNDLTKTLSTGFTPPSNLFEVDFDQTVQEDEQLLSDFNATAVFPLDLADPPMSLPMEEVPKAEDDSEVVVKIDDSEVVQTWSLSGLDIESSSMAQAFPLNSEPLDPWFVEALRRPQNMIYSQLKLSYNSSEMIMLRFDQNTCGIMSIVNGPKENPWRTLIGPLLNDYPALYHAVASMTHFTEARQSPPSKSMATITSRRASVS
ncbi:hypothetical protein MRB53_039052 [Persea americana]|nr:hypothetical protein MRB53_039052 [Persea americana]